jgi:hypothetical protein
MKKVVGIWIDHRKAIVVTSSDKGESIQHIESNVEKHPGRFNGVQSTDSHELQLLQADDTKQRVFTQHLNGFYNEVLASIGGAESVLIIGPGEAKGEIKTLMEQTNHCERTVVLESADKMTDGQIAAKVRKCFTKMRMR